MMKKEKLKIEEYMRDPYYKDNEEYLLKIHVSAKNAHSRTCIVVMRTVGTLLLE